MKFLDFLTLEDKTDMLTRSVGKRLPLYAGNIAEERRSLLFRGRSLELRIFLRDSATQMTPLRDGGDGMDFGKFVLPSLKHLLT